MLRYVDGVAQWTPNPLVVDNVGSVKYLGLEIAIDGGGKTQFALSKRVARVTTSVISSRIASPTLKYTVARTSTMAKLLYSLRLSNWSLAQYQELDHSLSAIFRKATRNQRSFPTALLYLPTNLGGLGLKRLSDLVQMEKWSTIHRMIRCGGTIQTVVQGIVKNSFHRANIFPTYDSACFYMAPLTRTQPTFMTS